MEEEDKTALQDGLEPLHEQGESSDHGTSPGNQRPDRSYSPMRYATVRTAPRSVTCRTMGRYFLGDGTSASGSPEDSRANAQYGHGPPGCQHENHEASA